MGSDRNQLPPRLADILTVADVFRVHNVITKLSVGGAQETALRYCRGLEKGRWSVALVSGCEASPEGDLADEADRSGIRVLLVPSLRRSVHPWADVRALVALIRLFRVERPEIVHTHSSKAGVLGRLAAKLAGVPVIVHTVHGWSFHEGMRPMVRSSAVAIERLAARWTSALVVVAHRDAEIGASEGIGHPEQYAVVRSGIEVGAYDHSPGARAEARMRLAVPEGKPVIGTVTRLSRQKDPHTLLAAVRRVVDSCPDAHCFVIGDGPLRPEVDARVDELGLRPHVTLLGSRHDVAALLPGFDVFVLSSRWEGLPRVVLEAMAAGVPVISTDAGGVAEAVEDGTSGLLVPIGDGEALASGVLRVLGDRELAGRMAEAAELRVQAFDTTEMIARLEELYARLLTPVRSRPRRRRMARRLPTASGQEAK